jgi:hypothetical protein
MLDLRDKFSTPPKMTKKGDGVSLNSRHLMIHYFFNVLGETVPRNTPKDKLPSIDAAALGKMRNPFAPRLARWRSVKKAMESLVNAASFVLPEDQFAKDNLTSPTGERAVFQFQVVGFDNVERAFTLSERSIPLNIDKAGRAAFITPAPSLDISAIKNPRTQQVLQALQAEPPHEKPMPSLNNLAATP